ncbi:MAG TPA: hypothetical protein VN088_07975 [Nocardioides sp.]|nr:hypothetical protein [Nocardioides sp.]
MSQHPPPPGPPNPEPYGAPQPSGAWDLGAAFNYAWAKFQANAAQMVLATAVLFVVTLVVGGIGFFVASLAIVSKHYECDPATYDCRFTGGTPFFLVMLIYVILGIVVMVIQQIFAAGIARASLGVTEGRPFSAAEVFRFDTNVILTGILVSVLSGVAAIFCYLPGLALFCMICWAPFFAIDKAMAPMDAIRASFAMVHANFSSAGVWFLIGLVIYFVGEAACGVGLLVAIPVIALGSAYTYRVLQGQPVSA